MPDFQLAPLLKLRRGLVERSDVLLENFAPGVMGRLGLTWELLHIWNPRLILASHSLQGQTGPRSRHRGCDSGDHLGCGAHARGRSLS